MIFDFLEPIFRELLIGIDKKKAKKCYELIEIIRESNDSKEIDVLLHKLSDTHFLLSPIAFPVFDKRRELCIEKVEPIIVKINGSSDVYEIRNLYQKANYWASWSLAPELYDLINNSIYNKIILIINQMCEANEVNEIRNLYSVAIALIDCLPNSKTIELHTHLYDFLQTKSKTILSQLKECDISDELTILYRNIKLILGLLAGTSLEKDLSKSLSRIMEEKKDLAIGLLKESNSLVEIDLYFQFLYDRYSSLSKEERRIVVQSLIDKTDFIIDEIKNNDSSDVYRAETTVLMIQVLLREDKERELNNVLISKAKKIIQELYDSSDIGEIKDLFLRACFVYDTIDHKYNDGIYKQLVDVMIEKINFIINIVKEGSSQEKISNLLSDLIYLVDKLPPFVEEKQLIKQEVNHLIEEYNHPGIDEMISPKTKKIVMK